MSIVLALLLGISQGAAPAARVDANTPRDRQISLAESAAPEDVGKHATIYILGKRGYEKAREGTNGFSCLVERERPDTMEPECYDAEGTATTLAVCFFTEEQRAHGTAEADISRKIEEGYRSGKFHAPSKSGIVYMLSTENHVFNPETGTVISFPGHLMFYAPYMTQKDLGGAAGPGMPYLVHPGQPDALMIVVPASAPHSH
jgi:hypothetical protein